ncbi:phycobilisome family protein [Lyngbya aestuarii BL J]|uniref:Phycobilisome family protein n=1 Tax=Lyngbya aestuarii BL J TaxID=1348334 RepID=U7QNK8_9CYAN|nr:phycobilisome family protein [Lyngbya aestuarii]ERT08867.1 phycobilisome family protein [Lyngbya aestuarii BL J]
MLTERAKQLIPKARIVSFANWESTYPPATVAMFQAADDEGRYPSDTDLDQLVATFGTFPEAEKSAALARVGVVRLLRDQANTIVTESRETLLAQYPGITDPGGDLYPPERAKACWRDFWHFLRSITYGIAGGQTEYTSAEGLHYMELLYQELNVPLQAMVSGLEGLKTASLKRLPVTDPQTIAPYFDHLIHQMRRFLP